MKSPQLGTELRSLAVLLSSGHIAKVEPWQLRSYAGAAALAALHVDPPAGLPEVGADEPADDDEPVKPKKAKPARERPAAGACATTGGRHRYGDGGKCACGATKRGVIVDPPSAPLPGVA